MSRRQTFKTVIDKEFDAWERIVIALVGFLETGRFSRDYSKVTYHVDDRGGLTVGWHQMALTTNSRLLNKAVDAYMKADKARYKEALRPYLDGLTSWDVSTQANTDLHKLFKRMAYDPRWRAIQDESAVAIYENALGVCDDRKWQTDLAFAVMFDSTVHGSRDYMLRKTQEGIEGKGKFAKALQDFKGEKLWEQKSQDDSDLLEEKGFIQAYNVCRRAWLGGFSDAYTAGTLYRQNTFLKMIENKSWTFEFGMEIELFCPRYRVGEIETITDELLLPSLPV